MAGVKLLFICALATICAGQGCDEGWESFEGNCYMLTDNTKDEMSWHNAREMCLSEGADLASINSQEEQDFIKGVAEAGSYTDAFWLGLNKYPGPSGDYGWSDGSEVSHTSWAVDQPADENLKFCAFSAVEPPDNCFNIREHRNVIYGLMYYPWDAQYPDTHNFGYEWTYDYPQFCEDACAREKYCDAWTYFTPYYYDYTYQWIGYCCGRSDKDKVDTPDQDTWSGTRYSCGEAGLWYTGNCGLNKGYVCKKPESGGELQTPPPTPPASGFCPEGWLDAGNKCYQMVRLSNQEGDGLSWNQALAMCRNQNVAGLRDIDLAALNNEDENALMAYNIQMRSYGFWTGGHKWRSGDDWGWSDNTGFTYTNWAPNEPSGGDDCIELWVQPGPVGTWNDLNCEDLRGYICQGWKDDSINEPPPTTPHACPEGYTPYWYGCYKLYSGEDAGSWTDGEQACAMEGGHLASIHVEPENIFIKQMAKSAGGGNVWIGWRKGGDDVYRWTDGWPNSGYDRWANNEPGNREGCVYMDKDGEWYDGVCGDTASFICKQTDLPRPTTPAPGDGVCPNNNWKGYGDYCYYFGTTYDYPDYDKHDWATAIGKCKENAGPSFASEAHLASIHSDLENYFIRTELERIKSEDNVWDLSSAWIGLSKKDFGEPYTWSDGTPVDFIKWAPGEPNDKDGTENCGEFYVDHWPGMYNDMSCNEARYYVCKVPRGDPPTTPTLPPILPGNCPDEEWEEYGEHCYLIRPDDYESWVDAHGTCIQRTSGFAHRAALVSVHTGNENWWLSNKLVEKSNMPVRRGAWLGFSRQTPDGDWGWIDGSDVVFQNWIPGQPEDQLCGEMTTEDNTLGLWNDDDCSGLKGFVCKVDKDTGGMRHQSDEIDDRRHHPELFIHDYVRQQPENQSHHKKEKADTPHHSGKPVDAASVVMATLVGLVAVAGIVAGVMYVKDKRRSRKTAQEPTVESVEVY